MNPAKNVLEHVLYILMTLDLVSVDRKTGKYKATEKALHLDDEQLEEMLDQALGPSWRQKRVDEA